MKIRFVLVAFFASIACSSGRSDGPPAGDSGGSGSHTNHGDSDSDVPGDSDPEPGDTDPEPGDTNVPPDTVLVGGPPATCEVYEIDIPVDGHGQHNPEGTVIEYAHNPPAGGPDYEMWAAYDRYDEPVERPRWQHNLRHGAIVLIYRPDAPAEVIDALATALDYIPTPGGKYNADPRCPSLGIMTPDPLLDETFAVMAFGKMMTSNCAPELDDIRDFAERHIYEAPEKECWPGAWPVREPCFRYEAVRKAEWSYEVAEGSYVEYADNPPSSGPYYPNMLAYGRYDVVVPRPYWTGILAHGGIVVLYRPDAPAETIAGLKAAYDTLPEFSECGHTMTAMVQDPLLTTPWAMVGNMQYMHGQCFQGWEMQMFVSSRRGWGPLDRCTEGTYVPWTPPEEDPPLPPVEEPPADEPPADEPAPEEPPAEPPPT
jgi:hypothetical protein